jgi:hypothetical protein
MRRPAVGEERTGGCGILVETGKEGRVTVPVPCSTQPVSSSLASFSRVAIVVVHTDMIHLSFVCFKGG